MLYDNHNYLCVIGKHIYEVRTMAFVAAVVVVVVVDIERVRKDIVCCASQPNTRIGNRWQQQ